MELYPEFIACNIRKQITLGKYDCNENNVIIQKYIKLNKKNPFTYNGKINHNNLTLKDIVKVNDIKYGCNHKLIGEKGLFCTKAIAKGTALGVYIGKIFDVNDYEHRFGTNANDLFEWKTKKDPLIIAPSSDKMLLRFINDARLSSAKKCNNNNNVAGIQTSIHKVPCIILYTTKKIAKYSQLLMSYGEQYWQAIAQYN